MNQNFVSNLFRKALNHKKWCSVPFSLFVIMIFTVTMTGCAQKVQACCQVINIEAKNTITARDTTTGRTFQFQVGPGDGITLKIGDPVNADLTTGKVTSINGVAKTYTAFEPDNAEPCCEIVSIQPNPGEPCCQIIGARNNATNATFQFKAEGVKLLQSLTVGQAVNVIGTWATIQSSAIPGLGNQAATFSFAMSPSK